ncbi:MAG: DUF5675 family protein [bacterium]|nr:DUF5675 family protein [bacterium]
MRLEVLRYSSKDESTLGLLFDVTDGREFLCYTLEDEHRDVKVKHETRIPAGTYNLKLREWGGTHERYKKRFKNIHEGMIEILDVPGFTHILIHCGNDAKDTSGCLLLGNSQTENVVSNGFVGESSAAYRRIYPLIANSIKCCGAHIEYIDFDG